MDALGLALAPRAAVRYKHMMPEDREIWTRFLEGRRFLPEEVWYDVRVGRGIAVPTERPAWMEKFVEYSYRKRIDVVGRKGADYWIIEAKPSAGIVALGQVIYYSLAFEAAYKPRGRVIPMVVTDLVDPDVLSVFEAVGVVVVEVGLRGG